MATEQKTEEQNEEDDFRLENARIEHIGLYYFGHGRELSIKAELAGRGWGCTITIPARKIGKFVEMFDDELDGRVEDGIFVEELKGKPVRVMYDGKDFNSKVIGIGDILCDENDILLLYD